jgi:hypothetical protein
MHARKERITVMDSNHPSLATLIMAVVFWGVVLWMVGYVIRQVWRRFRWDLLYAGGATSILIWVCWVISDLNNVLYHTALWFAWPFFTILVLFSTDWLVKRAEKH